MPEPLKCIVVDDEPPARELMRRYIGSVPELSLEYVCENALEAMGILRQHSIQLAFVDINMPLLSGTDFVRTLANPPAVIFTTAHRDYAFDGFELNAMDFLLKPVSFERFLKAVNKVMDRQQEWVPLAAPGSIKEAETPGNENAFIYVRIDRKMVKLLLKDILYLESLKDYVRIRMREGVFVVRQSLSSLEEMLPERDFIRTHRSFIANRRHIKAYTHEMLEIGAEELPIGRLFRNELMKKL